MQIIKTNDNVIDETVMFTCQHCKTEFICEKDEYWKETNVMSLTYPPQCLCRTACPKCHKICATNVKDPSCKLEDLKITF